MRQATTLALPRNIAGPPTMQLPQSQLSSQALQDAQVSAIKDKHHAAIANSGWCKDVCARLVFWALLVSMIFTVCVFHLALPIAKQITVLLVQFVRVSSTWEPRQRHCHCAGIRCGALRCQSYSVRALFPRMLESLSIGTLTAACTSNATLRSLSSIGWSQGLSQHRFLQRQAQDGSQCAF